MGFPWAADAGQRRDLFVLYRKKGEGLVNFVDWNIHFKKSTKKKKNWFWSIWKGGMAGKEGNQPDEAEKGIPN